MAYDSTTGKIYVDASVTPNIGVSIDDLKRCFGVVIEKVSDTNAKGVSCDLGVIVSKKAGETFTDVNGVQWRVKSRREVNKWATFKPMPTGTVERIYRDDSAPYGIRSIYNFVNPYDGTVSNSNSTTLQSTVDALTNALNGGTSSVFLDELAIYIPPTGASSHAYRINDFVKTQSTLGSSQLNGTANVHGYKRDAQLRFGYYNRSGVYLGISRCIKIGSDGEIVADENQQLEDLDMSSYVDLDTRLGWGSASENDLCILDWLVAMYKIHNKTVHRGVVIWTTDGIEIPAAVAVKTIPWSCALGQRMIGNGSSFNWHCLEFLTTADINTTNDFIRLSNWNYNDREYWMLIPGMIFTNLHIGSRDPYSVGAYFVLADVSPFTYKFNLLMRITDLGANTSLKVFLSDTENPGSIRDFVRNNSQYYTASTTGDHYIYGASNSGITMYPSDYDPSNTSITNRFNQVFTVGQIYYLCIWGKKNATDSSEKVIWSQPLVATMADSLEIAQ